MADLMRAYLLRELGDISADTKPLVLADVPRPEPGAGEILLRVLACGICHTELDEIEGRTAPPVLPVIPGHQVVGEVVATGDGDIPFKIGARVGVAWIYTACGLCDLCREGLENLCDNFQGTGRDQNGGYAEFMVVPGHSAYLIPEGFTNSEAAPLLCGGAIGYRSLKLTGLKNGDVLGLTGFGASAHLVLKMVQGMYPDSKVLVFARSKEQRNFSLRLGAVWAGDITDTPPYSPKSIIDTTPVWAPVLSGLRVLAAGGRLVINAIRKKNRDAYILQELDYTHQLWLEKEIKSVANITRVDVREFLELADRLKIRPEVTEYSFESANKALLELKYTRSTGAKVLVMK